MDKIIEYVKPDAELEKIEPSVKKVVLDAGKEAKILALEEINARSVRPILHCNTAQGQRILDQMHKDGKLKTKQERYTELYPPKDIEEPVVPKKVVSQDTFESIGLSAKIISDLSESGVTTIAQLEGMTSSEVLAIDGIGPVSLQAIIDALASVGKSLA